LNTSIFIVPAVIFNAMENSRFVSVIQIIKKVKKDIAYLILVMNIIIGLRVLCL